MVNLKATKNSGIATVVRNIFSLDFRSLAIFRILIALGLIVDLLVRLANLEDFYTDRGIVPRSATHVGLGQAKMWSLHTLSGQSDFILMLWIMQFIFAIMLLIGYRTRLATFLSWILFASIISRNMVISIGSEDLLRLMLFWGMFVPLNLAYSVDAKQSKFTLNSKGILNSGTLAILFQIFLMYWWTAVLKWHPRWLTEGSAIYYALALDQYVKPLGLHLREWPMEYLAFLTKSILAFEIIGPFLFFITWKRGLFRLIGAFLFIFFHLMLGLTIDLGLFPFFCMAIWTITIPTTFWDVWLPDILDRIVQLRKNTLSIFGRLILPRNLGLLSHPEIPRVNNPFIYNLIVIFCFGIAAYWNLAVWRPNDRWTIPSPIYEIGLGLKLQQHWNMFAPFPLIENGWYVTEARLVNGSIFDVWNNQPVEFSTRKVLPHSLTNSFWRRYLFNIRRRGYEGHRQYFGNYLCRRWNEANSPDRRAESIDVYYILETTPPPGQQRLSLQREHVWRQQCR